MFTVHRRQVFVSDAKVAIGSWALGARLVLIKIAPIAILVPLPVRNALPAIESLAPLANDARIHIALSATTRQVAVRSAFQDIEL